MIRAMTLDAHGTLIVPTPSVGAVYAEVAAGMGHHRDPAELEAAFLPAFAAVRSRWPVPYGGSEADALRFWDEVVGLTFGSAAPVGIGPACFAAFAEPGRWRVLPGVADLLGWAGARALPTAVISNFDGRLQTILSGLGLRFSAIITSAAVGRAKPDPATMAAACAALGVRPTEILHLGDHPREDGALCAATGARWLPIDPRIGIPVAEVERIVDGRLGSMPRTA
ncbi:hypothetical protein LBMAG53_16980 [Planctomycetota bacterium]|nr:hypothetical protein LBMAG53_16980 [Planctomycetota bacterium]